MWWRNTGITPYCYLHNLLLVVTVVTDVLVLWRESFQRIRIEESTLSSVCSAHKQNRAMITIWAPCVL